MVGKEDAYCVCLCSFICVEVKLYVIAKKIEVFISFYKIIWRGNEMKTVSVFQIQEKKRFKFAII